MATRILSTTLFVLLTINNDKSPLEFQQLKIAIPANNNKYVTTGSNTMLCVQLTINLALLEAHTQT